MLLARSWDDGGSSLGRLVTSAGSLEGPAGAAVVRGGLEALADHLDDADAGDWRVRRATADAVSSGLADGLAAHIALAGTALTGSAAGELAPTDAALLRGLGYVTLDRHAARTVEEALTGWVQAQPTPAWISGPPPLQPAIVVPNAYLAVQDYGQRLAYSLDQFEAKREADDRAFLWNMTVGLAVEFPAGPWGMAAGVVVDYLAMGLHVDGSWETGGDQRPRFRPAVPGLSALASLTPQEWTAVDRMARMAQTSFESTAHALGAPNVPISTGTAWWQPLLYALAPGLGDVLDMARRSHLPVSPVR